MGNWEKYKSLKRKNDVSLIYFLNKNYRKFNKSKKV